MILLLASDSVVIVVLSRIYGRDREIQLGLDGQTQVSGWGV